MNYIHTLWLILITDPSTELPRHLPFCQFSGIWKTISLYTFKKILSLWRYMCHSKRRQYVLFKNNLVWLITSKHLNIKVQVMCTLAPGSANVGDPLFCYHRPFYHLMCIFICLLNSVPVCLLELQNWVVCNKVRCLSLLNFLLLWTISLSLKLETHPGFLHPVPLS